MNEERMPFRMITKEEKEQMERMKKQKSPDFIICLPGHPSSGVQEMNLINTITGLLGQGKTFGIAHAEACNIYGVRNGCLIGKDQQARRFQRPFHGRYDDYGKIVWIDQDNIINPQSLLRLISYDVDMVAAWYRQYGGQGPLSDDNKTACGLWERGDGFSMVRPILVGEIPRWPRNELGLIDVDYAGFGLMVVKKGVTESLEYPWFRSEVIQWKGDITDPKTGEVEKDVEMAEISTDDEDFCHRAKTKGFKIMVDPEVRILHQKMVLV